MVLVVKDNQKKSSTFLRQVIAYSFLIGMFGWYYFHLSSEYQKSNDKLSKELQASKAREAAQKNMTKKIEKLILKEAESCVELIGQSKIQSIQIVKDKISIVCDWDSNIEPVFIRYGVMALVKSTPENIKISIDLKFIVESNYEA